MSVFFTFWAKDYGLFVDESSSTNNQGVSLWFGFICGIAVQNIGYFYIIFTSNWQSVSDRAKARQMVETITESKAKIEEKLLEDLEKFSD